MTTVTDRSLTGEDFSVFVSEQTTKGAIDATPEFTPVRRTEGKGKKTIAYTTSGLVDSERQAPSQIQDGKDLTAEISTEMTKQNIRFLLASIYGAEVATTSTAITFGADALGYTSTASAFANLAVNDYVWFVGFADSGNDGLRRVTVKNSSDSIETYPAPASVEAAGASVTMTSRKTFNAKDSTYYALQTRAVDLSKAGDVDYHTIYDGIIDTQNLEIGETGIVTSSMSMLFENEVAGTAIISGQTDAAAETDTPVGSTNDILDFFVDGLTAKCTVKSLSIEIANNHSSDDAAACDKRYGFGAFNATGSVSVRAPISAPFTWRDKAYNATPVSIGVHLKHSATEETVIIIKRAKVTENEMADGSSVISSSEASFSAEKDPVSLHTVEVFKNWV